MADSVLELSLEKPTVKPNTARESVSEQLTSARLSTGNGLSIGHRRFSSEHKKNTQILVLHPARSQNNESDVFWEVVEERLKPTNDSQLRAEVVRLKAELRAVKTVREEERAGQLALIGDLEGQLQELSRDQLHLKAALLSKTHALDKAAVEMQTAQLAALHKSTELQSLLLSQRNLQDSVDELRSLIGNLECEKATYQQEAQELRTTVTRLQQDLKVAYTRIAVLEEQRKQREVTRQLCSQSEAPSADSVKPGAEQSSLSELLAEARRQLKAPASEVQTWTQRLQACEAALSQSTPATQAALQLELLLIKQSLATAQLRQQV